MLLNISALSFGDSQNYIDRILCSNVRFPWSRFASLDSYVKVARRSDTIRSSRSRDSIFSWAFELCPNCLSALKKSSPVLNQQVKQFAYFKVFRTPQYSSTMSTTPFRNIALLGVGPPLQIRLNGSNSLSLGNRQPRI
jgi:hypothetical protein